MHALTHWQAPLNNPILLCASHITNPHSPPYQAIGTPSTRPPLKPAQDTQPPPQTLSHSHHPTHTQNQSNHPTHVTGTTLLHKLQASTTEIHRPHRKSTDVLTQRPHSPPKMNKRNPILTIHKTATTPQVLGHHNPHRTPQ